MRAFGQKIASFMYNDLKSRGIAELLGMAPAGAWFASRSCVMRLASRDQPNVASTDPEDAGAPPKIPSSERGCVDDLASSFITLRRSAGDPRASSPSLAQSGARSSRGHRSRAANVERGSGVRRRAVKEWSATGPMQGREEDETERREEAAIQQAWVACVAS